MGHDETRQDRTGGATRHTRVDRPRAPLVDPRKLVLRSGEADSQTFDLAEPSFAFGFGDTGEQVVPVIAQLTSACTTRRLERLQPVPLRICRTPTAHAAILTPTPRSGQETRETVPGAASGNHRRVGCLDSRQLA